MISWQTQGPESAYLQGFVNFHFTYDYFGYAVMLMVQVEQELDQFL